MLVAPKTFSVIELQIVILCYLFESLQMDVVIFFRLAAHDYIVHIA